MNSINSYNYDVYNDINARTNGEIYIGVVGPVRTGKSTFIKRFMDLVVIPNIKDENNKERAIDELPQSANGKSIMTTEPKFIPKDAIEVSLDNTINMKIRLIDCVGYMVEGALGHEENEKERMVKTPWFEYEIPFVKAAEIGTRKVINDHSTIGIMVTTDGSFGEIPGDAYIDAEEKTVKELKAIGKPFVILLNSSKPYSAETVKFAKDMEERYETKVIPVSCLNLKKEDIENILIEILNAFKIEYMEFNMPKWVETLDEDNIIKKDLIDRVKKIILKIDKVKDTSKYNLMDVIYETEGNEQEKYVQYCKLDSIDMQRGIIRVVFEIYDKYYYDMLSTLTGVKINNECELIDILKELTSKKEEFEKVGEAYIDVRNKGYGVITPNINEISIEDPMIVKHGNKYGIKIKATAPSTHLLKADITTEIAPIVGSEEQAQDLIEFLQKSSLENSEGIWNTNIFGKSIKQLVEEGIHTKVNNMNDETKEKMQQTLQKLINDSKGGVICIII